MSNIFNRVGMSTATAGTGTITLGSALGAVAINLAAFQSFATAGVANLMFVNYLIVDANGGWEVGRGQYTSIGTTLTRNVIASSNSNAAIILSGSAQVYITAIATDYPIPDNYLAGLTLSNDGTSPNTVLDIAAGVAADNTNTDLMRLASAITKTTGAWAVGTGNGGLDTGSVAINTWYHVYLIRRPDTGVVDVLFSTSASSPTMPTNYTQKRRIGSFKTATGTTNILAFTQVGDEFLWNAVVQDANSANPGTAAFLTTLTVPTGVNVQAIITHGTTADNSNSTYVSSPLVSDQAVSFSSVITYSTITGQTTTVAMRIMTNTSAQVRSRINVSDAGITVFINTAGWVDTRGRLS